MIQEVATSQSASAVSTTLKYVWGISECACLLLVTTTTDAAAEVASNILLLIFPPLRASLEPGLKSRLNLNLSRQRAIDYIPLSGPDPEPGDTRIRAGHIVPRNNCALPILTRRKFRLPALEPGRKQGRRLRHQGKGSPQTSKIPQHLSDLGAPRFLQRSRRPARPCSADYIQLSLPNEQTSNYQQRCLT